MMFPIRTYSELIKISSFEDRFAYLDLRGIVGESTFGFNRWVNQRFYTSREWRRVRSYVTARDNGCDLGVEGYEIYSGAMVHHMNPVSMEDLSHPDALEPEFLILVSHRTHNAIHFGGQDSLPKQPVERVTGDTTLW